MDIGKNIKAYRKKLGLTQEELAEKMGVSVGAVSKWESGANFPELPLLIRLAQCFKVSLDALTGFELNSKDKATCIEQIKQLTSSKSYKEGVEQVEEILAVYPNDFQILLHTARFYLLKGMEQEDKASLERAIWLHRKAILFLDQNSNPRITKPVLEDQIAKLLIELGQYTEALEILEKNNSYNVNDFLIAQTMVQHLDQSEQALPLLSLEFYMLLSKLSQLSLTFAQAYYQLGRVEDALDILQRSWPLLASFIQADQASIFDKMQVIHSAAQAIMLYDLGREEASADALRTAKKAAQRFDQNPNFSLQGFPHFYLEDNYYIYDDSGDNSLEAIGSTIKKFSPEQVYQLWEQIKQEESDGINHE